MIKKIGIKKVILSIVMLLGIAGCCVVLNKRNSDKLHVITLEGHTDAILLESNGYFGMIDSGEDTDAPDGLDNRYPFRSKTTRSGYGFETQVIDYMKTIGVNEDNFVFYLGTHPHSDHIGSADEIIHEFKPDRIYMMEYRDEYISEEECLWDNLYVYDNMIAAAKDVGAVIIQNFDIDAPVIHENLETFDLNEKPEIVPKSEDGREYYYYSPEEINDIYGVDPRDLVINKNGSNMKKIAVLNSNDPDSVLERKNISTTGNPNFLLGDMQISIVNYSDDYKTEPKPDANCFSLGVLVNINGYRIFLAGDIGNIDGDENRLVPILGHVDVLKLGHHGSASSNTVNYLDELSPDFIISTGAFKTLLKAPDRIETLNKLAIKQGTRLYETVDCASIVSAIVLEFNDSVIKCNVPVKKK